MNHDKRKIFDYTKKSNSSLNEDSKERKRIITFLKVQLQKIDLIETKFLRIFVRKIFFVLINKKMKCRHHLQIKDCDICSKVVVVKAKHHKKSSSEECGQQVKNKNYCCKEAFVSAYIQTSVETEPIIVRSFAPAELLPEGTTFGGTGGTPTGFGAGSGLCTPFAITGTCDIPLLNLSECQKPKNKWCRVVDRQNGFFASLQVPKCCGGCYNFELSASLVLTATFNPGLLTSLLSAVLGLLGTDATLPSEFTVPFTYDLKLAEQECRTRCVVDSVASQETGCFTANLLPILDAPSASASNTNTVGVGQFQPVNAAVAGILCLHGCERLIPAVSLRSVGITSGGNFQLVSDVLSLVGGLLTLLLTILGGLLPGVGADIQTVLLGAITGFRLRLANLSLKLMRLGDCPADCDCHRRKY